MAAITGDRRVGPGPCHARAPQSVRSPPVRDPPPSDPWADGPAPQQHHSDLRRVPSRDNEADYEDRSGWRRAPHAASLQSLRIARSEEHTSELQSLMRISYAVFCLKKKKTHAYKQ